MAPRGSNYSVEGISKYPRLFKSNIQYLFIAQDPSVNIERETLLILRNKKIFGFKKSDKV
jgi:hypothetical protein